MDSLIHRGMNQIENELKKVDSNIREAVHVWIKYGIDPGSCTKLLLEGKYDKALLHAHPLIKPYWKDHIAYIESIPEKYRGKNMKSHKLEKK